MAYTKVQFIGYVIDTAPQLNPDGSETYLGLNIPAQDIEARCALMLRAMETAAAAVPQASPPGDTLYVFLAPEFFFRGPTGAYQMDDVQVLITALQTMAADPRWTDWVFGFGTIVGTSSPANAADPQEVYNFCLVQEGGAAAQGDAGARVVMKELMSGIDFIAGVANPGGLLLGEVEHLPPARPGGLGREQQQLNYDGAGIFQLRGITWAVEICLDHSEDEQRLQQSPQMPGDSMVQLQLVPSCGMTIQEASVICEDGGLVFNADGYRDTRHSALALLEPPLDDVPMIRSVAVSGAPLTAPGSPPPQPVPVASLYASGPGVVNIYPAQAVPPAQTVQGSTVKLVWPASDAWTFIFWLVYAPNGAFSTVLCEIKCKTVNFYGNQYFLPLLLDTLDNAGQAVQVQIELAPGSSGFAGAVWCKVSAPGFVFEGNAFEFSGQASGPPPETIW